MVDHGILQFLQPPPPPALPPSVIERSWPDRGTVAPEVRADWIVDGFKDSVAAWHRTLDHHRQALELRAGTMIVGRAELTILTRMIGLLEEAAEQAAEAAARFRKVSTRQVKVLMRDAPAKGAVAKIVARGLGEANDEIVGTLLDHALFFRALRAEHDPEARGGPVFEDAAALEKHLLSAMG